MKNYLEFEKDIKKLEQELVNLKSPYESGGLSEVDTNKIDKIESEIENKLSQVYQKLNSWQKTLVARHEDRPKANFYINKIISNFTMLTGDRLFSEDNSVIAGFGTIDGQSVLVIGQEKGDDLNSRIKRNFGMMRPEGYRKTIRLMNLANKFKIPIISFIDTPGAYPGVGAEERGQAEAIAKSIECCMELKVPTIAIIIGEGGSGGAIALASSNKVIMLENAIYSVISPEGCATILWRDPKKMLDAAKAMKLSAKDLLKLKVIDEIIPEPLGGAHRDRDLMLDYVRKSISTNLDRYKEMTSEDIMNERKNKFLKIGRNDGFMNNAEDLGNLSIKKNNFDNIFKYSLSLFPSSKRKKLSQSFLEALDQASQIRGKTTWIEKTPQNLWFLPFIKSISKNIRFIHIEREPKDVIASIHYASTKHPESWGYQKIENCINLYKESKVFNDQYRSKESHYFCKYEDLTTDTTGVVKGILKFCKLEFYEDLLHNYKKSRNFISRKSDLWTSGISGEIKLQESRFYKHFPEEDQNYILSKLKEPS